MKYRQGFVSNSSSSSFMIKLKDLSALQYNKIINNDYSDDESCKDWDHWSIETRDGMLIGSTSMDNYNMEHFLTKIVGIPENKISWKEWDAWENDNCDDIPPLVEGLVNVIADELDYQNKNSLSEYRKIRKDGKITVKIDGEIDLVSIANEVLKFVRKEI